MPQDTLKICSESEIRKSVLTPKITSKQEKIGLKIKKKPDSIAMKMETWYNRYIIAKPGKVPFKMNVVIGINYINKLVMFDRYFN